MTSAGCCGTRTRLPRNTMSSFLAELLVCHRTHTLTCTDNTRHVLIYYQRVILVLLNSTWLARNPLRTPGLTALRSSAGCCLKPISAPDNDFQSSATTRFLNLDTFSSLEYIKPSSADNSESGLDVPLPKALCLFSQADVVVESPIFYLPTMRMLARGVHSGR